MEFEENARKKYGDVLDNILAKVEKPSVISTGVVSLDVSTGIGGVPKQRFTEIYGHEESGKTTLVYSIAGQAIKIGDKVLFIDAENSMDFEYAVVVSNGLIDEEHFIVARPQTAEQALNLIEIGINSGEFGLIILDSIASLAPKKEQTDELADAQVGLVPRLMSKFFRRNTFNVRTQDVAVVFTNQVRAKIGSYIPMLEPPGGYAVKHYTSLRIVLSKSSDIKEGNEKIGRSIKFTIKKNKLGPPMRGWTIPLIYGKGFDYYDDLLKFADFLGVVKRRGSFYRFDEVNYGPGVDKAIEKLSTEPEVLDKIVEMCYNSVYRTTEDEEENNGED